MKPTWYPFNVSFLIFLGACTVLRAEYQRYKFRGPPHPQRVHPSQQFAKKWHQPSYHPQRGPVRSRPVPSIPVHMPSAHKIPMGFPKSPSRPVAPPVRTFWKNTQTSMKLLPENTFKLPPSVPEKIYQSAPSKAAQEFDYHIQTNNIPMIHVNPIKQVGEKGPIHTIPAPNLSLRDKPIIAEELRQDMNFQQNSPYVKVEHSHQYQVTEQPDVSSQQQFYRSQQQQQHLHQQLLQQQQSLQQHAQQQQQLHQQLLQQQQSLQQHPPQQQTQQQQQQEQQQLLQQLHQHEHQELQHQLEQQRYLQIQQQLRQDQILQTELQKQLESQPQQFYFPSNPNTESQNLAQSSPQGNIYLSSQLSPKELYQLMGAAYPQGTTSQSNSQPEQSHEINHKYQRLATQHIFQPDQSYIDEMQEAETSHVASDKISFEPEYQSFNYDEQAHRNSQQGIAKKALSSLVTAADNLDSRTAAREQMSSRNSLNHIAQSQLVQSYFDTRSDIEENNVEPDAKPGVKSEERIDNIDDKLLDSAYYSSLPNKEAAERLAQLQAAGKVNSNLMKISSITEKANDRLTANNQDDFASDDNTYEESDKNDSQDILKPNLEYEDYSQEEVDNSASEENKEGFGKVQPKKEI